MKHLVLLFLVLSLFPLKALSFSSQELEDLKKEKYTKLRGEAGLYLRRNMEFEGEGIFDPKKQDSLLDPRQIYHSYFVSLYYSLKDTSFFKNPEMSLSLSLDSPLTGYRNDLVGYGVYEYLHYALGNLSLGLRSSVSSLPLRHLFSLTLLLPSNKGSLEDSLKVGSDISLSLIYPLRSYHIWNLSLNSSHSLSYFHYEEDKGASNEFNKTWFVNQALSLLIQQQSLKLLPSTLRLGLSYELRLDLDKTRFHTMKLSMSSSWKLRDQLYFLISVNTSNYLKVFNPENPSIKEPGQITGDFDPIKSFQRQLDGTYLSLGLSFSF